MNEKYCILICISRKFIPEDAIDNKSALFQVMAWRRTGDKPLSETMLPSSLTHICATRGRWVNSPCGGLWHQICLMLPWKLRTWLGLLFSWLTPEVSFKIKTFFSWYWNYKDKMVTRWSHIYYGNFCTDKIAALYWNNPLMKESFCVCAQPMRDSVTV